MRNPWKGISTWREFLYDMRHPVLFHKRAWNGAMGRDPHLPSELRFVGIAMVVGGFCMFCLGVVLAVLY